MYMGVPPSIPTQVAFHTSIAACTCTILLMSHSHHSVPHTTMCSIPMPLCSIPIHSCCCTQDYMSSHSSTNQISLHMTLPSRLSFITPGEKTMRAHMLLPGVCVCVCVRVRACMRACVRGVRVWWCVCVCGQICVWACVVCVLWFTASEGKV